MVGRMSTPPPRPRDGVAAVDVPGGRIAYRERGTGTPVVFLHGGTGTGEHDWGWIAGHLSSRYRTVVLDLRGHGRSPDHHARIGLVRFGLDLRHVLRAIGAPRAVLVGFSVGGNTLLRLLSQDPRVALALVTVGASSKGDASRVADIMSGPWPEYLTALDHPVGDGPEYWKQLRAALAHDWADNLALSDEQLRGVPVPALVCHGENDRIQQLDYAHHLAATLPDVELYVAPGAGHAVQLDAPDEFLARIEAFLARVVPARR